MGNFVFYSHAEAKEPSVKYILKETRHYGSSQVSFCIPDDMQINQLFFEYTSSNRDDNFIILRDFRRFTERTLSGDVILQIIIRSYKYTYEQSKVTSISDNGFDCYWHIGVLNFEFDHDKTMFLLNYPNLNYYPILPELGTLKPEHKDAFLKRSYH